jgi:general stress protein 26
MAPTDHEAEVKKVAELIKGIKFAMLTTAEEDGSLRSRPMATQQLEFDGTLWFFTSSATAKVSEINRDRHVNVSFADPDRQVYVSASGIARLVRDRKKIEELWNPVYNAFFPKGLDDPELALLQVAVETAEYWNSPGGSLARAFRFIKAAATHDPSAMGEHSTVRL